ncbi:hypothetical protein P7C70_g690, partial [Phenoliferia sp. Uapishka_3]
MSAYPPPYGLGRGFGRSTYLPTTSRSISLDRGSFRSKTPEYTYSGTSNLGHFSNRPRERRLSVGESDAFLPHQSALEGAQSRLAEARRNYERIHIYFVANGASINSPSHVALRRAQCEVANATAARDQAERALRGLGRPPHEYFHHRPLHEPHRPTRATTILVTKMRSIPGYDVIPIRKVVATSGNHDGIYRSPAQQATLRGRLEAIARAAGADAVIGLNLYDERDGVARQLTLVGEGMAVRLVQPFRAFR